MRMRMLVAAGLLLAFVGISAADDEKRWVTSDGTSLKAAASMTAESVADLPVGTELTIVENAGRWLKVRSAAGKEGWVYAGRVSDTRPTAEVTGGEGSMFGDSMQKSQINTAKADSARSIRGLSPEVSQYAKQRGTPEVFKKELDRVLARSVKSVELNRFLREGKIGEYAQ